MIRMANKRTYVVPYRRKREGKTDYHKRLSLVKSRLLRLVVRVTNQAVCMQVIAYRPQGDTVVASVTSRELVALGWPMTTGNIPEAYLTGLLLASKISDKSQDIIPDLGRCVSVKGSRLYAAIQGAQEGGLQIRCNKDAFPSADRITGGHIVAYATSLKDTDQYNKRFARYIANGVKPEQLVEVVEKVKASIKG